MYDQKKKKEKTNTCIIMIKKNSNVVLAPCTFTEIMITYTRKIQNIRR
jgi:hypothetical protein